MKKNSYIRCELYSINDNFSIDGAYSYKENVLNSEKKYVDTIVVEEHLGELTEVLTGETFDFSDIKVWDYYSKLFGRYILKKKKNRSSDPIHISLYSEDLISVHISRSNFDFVDQDDIDIYRENVLLKYGSIRNYKKHLIYLKEYANNIYDNAVNDFKCQKTLRKKK